MKTMTPASFFKLYIRVAIYIAVFSLLFSCAQVVSPGGGPKDTSPPTVVKYMPDSAATNFNSKSFSITFNEYVQLKDISGQLVVSPLLKKNPEVKIKNKTIVVTLEDTLKENTTYTFNFGSAIRDITEDNYTDGFRYIFSTGDFLDSISLSGKVTNAFDTKTEKGILVMIYDELDDSIPYKKPPSYFAKTKEDGTFSINNIKAGRYNVFALKDANANYMYDTDEESIGFMDAPIDLQKNDSVNISLFKEIPSRLFLKKAAVMGYGHLLFAFNKPVKKITIQPAYTTYKKQWYIEEYNEKRDSLHIWLSDAGEPDSLSIVLSENDKIIDTLFFNLVKKEDAFNPKRGGRGAGKLTLRAKANINAVQPLDLNKPIVLEFSHPIKNLEKDSIRYTSDSIETKLHLTRKLMNDRFFNFYDKGLYDTVYVDNNDTVPFHHKALWKEDVKNTFFIPPNTFTDIFGLSNDSININFTTREEKYYGTLKLKLSVPQFKENILLQLLGEKEEIIREDYLTGTHKDSIYSYTYLAPHNYKLKLIYDSNKNGKWDTGNYLGNVQPERVIYCKEEINIRTNWDHEIKWEIVE